MNQLINFADSQLTTLFTDPSIRLDKDSFVKHYKDFMVRDIADGNPADDTKSTYFSNVDLFLGWLARLGSINPLDCDERHIKAYREYLFQRQYKVPTISFKLTAIRRFYQCAKRLHIIEENPVQFVRPGKDPNASLPSIKYMSSGQFEFLLRSISVKNKDGTYNEVHYRDRLIMAIMGIEGLRTVEIKRMNIEDINWEFKTIMIRGKGHNDLIYPRDDILTSIRFYLDLKMKQIPRDKSGTPVFTVVSNNNQLARLSRQSIRKTVNFWFKKTGIRSDVSDHNFSCHLLRHTCGTLLYQETKDLQIVKETLRHRDLKMSSKYAHLQQRLVNRYTNTIPVKMD